MWLEDIQKVLDNLSKKYNCCVDKIEHNFVYLSNGEKIPFKDLL